MTKPQNIFKRVTIKDIAELAEVSPATVSVVLNGKGDAVQIKKATQAKILKIAQEHAYRGNIFAKSLKNQKTNTVGLIIPDFTNIGFGAIAKYLDRLCRAHDIQLITTCFDEKEDQELLAIHKLLDYHVDVMIITPVTQNAKLYAELNALVPTIQLDRLVNNLAVPYVVTAEEESVGDLVHHMIINQQLSEFYYCGGIPELSASKNRLQGFKNGFKGTNLTFQDEWLYERDYHSESGYLILEQIVNKLHRLPEALFTSSYGLFTGVMRYLNEHKMLNSLMDKTLHLATFDNYELLDNLSLGVNSIKQDSKLIAEKLFSMVVKVLNDEPIQESYTVQPKIIVRDL